MSAELALLSQINTNSDFYAVSEELYDSALMLDMSGAFPKATNPFSTVDTHDIFGDDSAVATYQFNDDATDLGGNYDGTNSGATFEDGKFDECATFNNTYINTPIIDALYEDVFSLSIWFKTKSYHEYSTIIEQNLTDSCASCSSVMVRLGNNSERITVYVGTKNYASVWQSDVDIDLTLNEWYDYNMIIYESNYSLYL